MRRCFFLLCERSDDAAVHTILARWRSAAALNRSVDSTAAIEALLNKTIRMMEREAGRSLALDNCVHDGQQGASSSSSATSSPDVAVVSKACADVTHAMSASASEGVYSRPSLSRELLGHGEMSALLWKTIQSHRVSWRVSLRLAPAQLAALPERQRRVLAAQIMQQPHHLPRHILQAWNSVFVHGEAGMTEVYASLRRCATVVQFAQGVSFALRSRPELHNVLPVPHDVLQHCFTLGGTPSTRLDRNQAGVMHVPNKSPEAHQDTHTWRTTSAPHKVAWRDTDTHASERASAIRHAESSELDTAAANVALRVCHHLSLLGRDTLPRHVRARLTLQYAQLYGRAGDWQRALDMVQHDRCIRFTTRALFGDYVRQQALLLSPPSQQEQHEQGRCAQSHTELGSLAESAAASSGNGSSPCAALPGHATPSESFRTSPTHPTIHPKHSDHPPHLGPMHTGMTAADVARFITEAATWSRALAMLLPYTSATSSHEASLCQTDAAYLAFLARPDHPASFDWSRQLDMYARVRAPAQSYRTLRPLLNQVPFHEVDYVVRTAAALAPVAMRMYAGTLARRLYHMTQHGHWADALALGCASTHYDVVAPLLARLTCAAGSAAVCGAHMTKAHTNKEPSRHGGEHAVAPVGGTARQRHVHLSHAAERTSGATDRAAAVAVAYRIPDELLHYQSAVQQLRPGATETKKTEEEEKGVRVVPASSHVRVSHSPAPSLANRADETEEAEAPALPVLLAHALHGDWRRVARCVRARQNDRLRSLLAAKHMAANDGDAGDWGEVNCYTFHAAHEARLVCRAATARKRDYFLSVLPAPYRAHHVEATGANTSLHEPGSHTRIDSTTTASSAPTSSRTRTRDEAYMALYQSYYHAAAGVSPNTASHDARVHVRVNVVRTVADCHVLLHRMTNYLDAKQRRRGTSHTTLNEEQLLRTLARLFAHGQGEDGVVQLHHGERHGLALALLAASTRCGVRLDASRVTAMLHTTIPAPYVRAHVPALQAAVEGLSLVGRWSTAMQWCADHVRPRGPLQTWLEGGGGAVLDDRGGRKCGDADACAPMRALMNAFAQAAYDSPARIRAGYLRRLWRASRGLWGGGVRRAARRRRGRPVCPSW